MKDTLTPKAIVASLDEHIIGQSEAKKAVAVALRNRWRRQRLSADLRDEVTPKNILMIGPTGCGKTEISRRLAKLADAPFVKVEATKFTEVGYVGRDVEQIARDLVEEAIRLEKERRRESVREAASKAAMDRLLNALVGEGASEATRAAFHERITQNAMNDTEVEIEVEDAPFMAVELITTGNGADQIITFRTNVDTFVSAGDNHPIRVDIDPDTGEPSPYVLVRRNLEALIDRKSFYRLVDLGQHRDGWFGVWSGGEFFGIIPSEDLP